MTTLAGNDLSCIKDSKSSKGFKNRINLVEGKGIWKNFKTIRKIEMEKGDFRFRANVNTPLWIRSSRNCSGNVRVQFD